MNALTKSNRTSSKSLHAALLLSAAASALLFSAIPAEAACTLDGTSNTITCTAGAGTALSTSLSPAITPPSATLAVDSGANVVGGFLFVAGGTTPGALIATIAQATGDTTTIGAISANGNPMAAANTATVTNAGGISGSLAFYDFGGLVTVTNQASGTIGSISAQSATGQTIFNAGTTASIYTDTISPYDPLYTGGVTSIGWSYASASNYTTGTTSSSRSNLGGLATVTNTGTVTDYITLWSKDADFNNSGKVGGDVNLNQLNSWGSDYKSTTTDVFLDPGATNAPSVTFATPVALLGVVPDSRVLTSDTLNTAWGGKETIANSGKISGQIYANALSDVSFTDSGLIVGPVSLNSDAANAEVKDIQTWTNDGTTAKYIDNYTNIVTRVGGVTTATITSAGELDNSFSASSLGGIAFTDSGLIKGPVRLIANDTNSETSNLNTTTVTALTTDQSWIGTQKNTPVGGAITAIIAAKPGEIDGSVTLSGFGAVSLDNAGLIKNGPVNVTSNVTASLYVHKTDTLNTPFTSTSTPIGPTTDSGTPTRTTSGNKYVESSANATTESEDWLYTPAGSSITFLNEATGTIGSGAVYLSGTTVVTAENDGAIGGSFSAYATSGTNKRSYTQGATTNHDYNSQWTQVVVNDPALLVTQQESYSSAGNTADAQTRSNGYSSVFTIGAGTASLLNAAGATITGTVTVGAYNGASIDNFGTLKGSNIYVNGSNSSNSVITCANSSAGYGSCTVGSITSPFQTAYAYSDASTDDYARVLAATSVATTRHYTDTWTTTNTFAGNLNSSSSTRGGDAGSLTNEAKSVIGDVAAYNGSATGSTVSVYGLSSALLSNAGTVYATATVSTAGGDRAETHSYDGLDTRTTRVDNTYSCTDVWCGAVTLSDEKTTGSYSSQSVAKDTYSFTPNGGAASYSGSGSFYGNNLFVAASLGDASINNSGWIGAQLGSGSVTAQSSDNAQNRVTTVTATNFGNFATETVRDYSTAVDLETITGSNHTGNSNQTVTANTYTPVGGTASLSNSGTIGGDALQPILVNIMSTTAAALGNDGLINGNVLLNAGGSPSEVFNLNNLTTTDDVSSSSKTTTISTGKKLTDTSKDVTVTTVANLTTDNFTSLASQATASNTLAGTITGNLTLSGSGGATASNMGQIWGVIYGASQTNNTTSSHALASTRTVTTAIDTVADTRNVTDVLSSKDDTINTSVSVGKDVVISNLGTIGKRINDINGATSFFENAGISTFANGNIALTNAKGAMIYGNVSGSASGATTANETLTALDRTVTVTSKAAGASPITTTHTVQTVTTTASSTPTGGSATLINNGSIGQRFAYAVNGGSGITPLFAVTLSGQGGASLTNAGLIGGNLLQVSSSATASASSDVTTTTTDTVVNSSKASANTNTITIAETSSTTNKVAGGKAVLNNNAAGQIGIDVLGSNASPVGTYASVIISGDAGASISNDGVIQGRSISAQSNQWNYSTTDVRGSTTKYAVGASPAYVSDTSSETRTQSWVATGGTAVFANTGKLLSSQNDGMLSVYVGGFGGATITNTKTGLIDNAAGSVTAESVSDTYTIVTTSTASNHAIGTTKTLVSETDTKAITDTMTGGTALVDNFGTIKGTVNSGGYGGGTVLNEVGAKIGGDVFAKSGYQSYAFTSTTNYVGPNYTPGVDTYTESYTWGGGNALVHNYGLISGNASANAYGSATITNETTAVIGGGININAGAYDDANGWAVNTVNDSTGGGVVTKTWVGGTANVTNYGTVNKGFDIESFAGSTLNNAAAAQLDTNGWGGYIYTYDVTKSQNGFTNTGIVGSIPLGSTLGTALLQAASLAGYNLANGSVIELRGNTAATNSGIIVEDLIFTSSYSTAGASNAVFTFKQGSVLAGSINAPSEVANAYGSSLANLTLNFDTSGLYQGNVYGASATNKTGSGTWILTGSALGLGATTVSAGTLELGTPLNYFLSNPSALINLALGSSWDPLQGTNPWSGNTAVNPALQGLGVTSNLVGALAGAPVVTGNLTIASGAAVNGHAIIVGNTTNNGTLLAGWMLPSNAAAPLGNLLDSTNQVLPSNIEVSGNYTQGASGTLVTNVAAAVSRPSRQLVGTQTALFAPTSYWLNVAPFSTSVTPSSFVTVDGSANVAGKVLVYVDKGGLYVNGASNDILASTGPLTVSATAAQSAPSLFVGFNLKTASVSGKNVLSVTVNRTSYSSVAATANQANIGKALDSAVPVVAAAVKANSFGSVDAFNQAQDMAGFLSDLDWQVTSSGQAASVLGAVSPDGYASLAGIDTGEGFRSQVMRHLGGLPGAAQASALTGAWVQGYGVSQTIGANNGASKLSASTTGTSLGWDIKVNDVVLGIAGGYARTTFNTPAKAFSGSINTYQAGAYASGDWEHLYVDGALWANFGTGRAQRALLVGDRIASANVKPSELRADLEGGWRFDVRGFGIAPYAGFTFRSKGLDDITEAGAGGLSYKLTNLGSDVITPDLGVRFDGVWAVTSLVAIKPLVGLGVEFRAKADDITAQFLGGGNAFSVNSAVKNDVAFKPEAGLNILVGSSVSLQLGYQGSIGGNRTTNGAWAGLRGNW